MHVVPDGPNIKPRGVFMLCHNLCDSVAVVFDESDNIADTNSI